MYHKRKSGTWWGMLESRKGDSVVVWDSVLPRGATGKVFLYNTHKGALVEYVEEIVQPKLRDLTTAESREAREQFDPDWNEIRSQFVEPEPEEAPESGTPKDSLQMDSGLPDLEDDGMEIDDDFEDL